MNLHDILKTRISYADPLLAPPLQHQQPAPTRIPWLRVAMMGLSAQRQVPALSCQVTTPVGMLVSAIASTINSIPRMAIVTCSMTAAVNSRLLVTQKYDITQFWYVGDGVES